MKNIDLFVVLDELKKLGKYPGAELGMARVELIKKINNHIDTLEKAVESSPKYEEFLKGKEELNLKYCIRKPDGNPDLKRAGEDNSGNPLYEYLFDKEVEDKRNKEFKKLAEKYKDDIELEKQKKEDYRELMDSECKLTLSPIPWKLLKNIPTLVGQDWENLYLFCLIKK